MMKEESPVMTSSDVADVIFLPNHCGLQIHTACMKRRTHTAKKEDSLFGGGETKGRDGGKYNFAGMDVQVLSIH